jgi:hypothetical protein
MAKLKQKLEILQFVKEPHKSLSMQFDNKESSVHLHDRRDTEYSQQQNQQRKSTQELQEWDISHFLKQNPNSLYQDTADPEKQQNKSEDFKLHHVFSSNNSR